jgi:hypothetical protein
MENIDGIKILWEDYKMRQAHYWNSLSRFTLAVITLWVLPYVRPDIVKALGLFVLIFPAIAFLLSVASTWLLGAEYQRLRAVKQRLDSLANGMFTLDYPTERWCHRCFSTSIGFVTTWLFGISSCVLSLIDGAMLLFVREQLMVLTRAVAP